jgi:hypothetical protein
MRDYTKRISNVDVALCSGLFSVYDWAPVDIQLMFERFDASEHFSLPRNNLCTADE